MSAGNSVCIVNHSDCLPAALAAHCDALLDAASFADYCPNGLQVDAARPVRRVVSGVTASLAQIEAAAEANADLLLVHHGYFWKGEDARLIGQKGRRIRRLMESGISLLAYHLPLDAHPVLGNNAQLARRLGLHDAAASALDPLLWAGHVEAPVAATELAGRIQTALGRKPLLIEAGSAPVRQLAWCTGAAARFIDQAVVLGVDAFITGEPSEPAVHAARESGVHLIAAGHHATERYGVQALGEHLMQQFDIEHHYIEIDNPV